DLLLDYLGLNHLGWVRAAWARGVDRLPEILASDDVIRAVYGRPLFTLEEIRRLRLLPNEYLQYYYHHDEILRRLREAPQTRGQAIAELAARLRAAVQQAVAKGADPLPAYEAAVFARRSSYMATETGQHRDLAMMGGRVGGGYAQAALDVIEALRGAEGGELIVNVPNDGGIDDLAPDDVVEVPCRINPSGPRPRRIGALPAAVRELVGRVKNYERSTVAAALGRRWPDAVAALAAHPLVPSTEIATKIADEYRRQHAPLFDYLR
ncbi:MAG TPA: 6-phospho-beta-glucosidase, partial [bacterium]|nr:6-phospho-beta-glucosidase [bacterium]